MFKAFDDYGRFLQLLYKTEEKREHFQSQDVSLSYLGYWTDNGKVQLAVILVVEKTVK